MMVMMVMVMACKKTHIHIHNLLTHVVARSCGELMQCFRFSGE